MAAGLELGGHLRVHRDHDLLLLGHDGVAILHLIADPVPERLAHNGSADINDPLLGHLPQVRVVREVHGDPRLFVDEVQDLLERQVLVLRHVQRLDRFVVQVSLLATKDVFEKVDGDVVCKKDTIN